MRLSAFVNLSGVAAPKNYESRQRLIWNSFMELHKLCVPVQFPYNDSNEQLASQTRLIEETLLLQLIGNAKCLDCPSLYLVARQSGSVLPLMSNQS